ncbi:hypothetical protein DE146DRAFT_791684 [Phaeosphaeria sp. MPI-PUGE-AT-0046c]|nr:hypothetical protein DE146DRAFT_791684 [Phaeosphaeria sp. MPI-PUGE-AT-0046c]
MKEPNSIISSTEEHEDSNPRSRSAPRLVQVALAFAIVFCPLVLVATLLCLFITLPRWTAENVPETNPNLPVHPLDDSVLWTNIRTNHVALTSSFASNIAQFAASPFLLLFSFLVALEIAKRNEDMDPAATKLLQSNQKIWTVYQIWRTRKTQKANGTTVAGLGALISLSLTVLLLAGDKLVQGTINEESPQTYGPNYVDSESDGSFKLNDTTCPPHQTIPDIYDTEAPPPCSIDNSSHDWAIYNAPTAYRVLANGLLNLTHDYHKEDFGALWSAYEVGVFDWTQLVTHIDTVTRDQHIFFFDPSWAQEDNDKHAHGKLDLMNDEYDRLGFDYIANTTSIVTKCLPITTNCGIHNTTGNNSSVPYHCSDIFQGDLNEIPNNGLERLKGWNTSFYTFDNGEPQQVSIASQLNPFSYNITATVDSINLDGLIDFEDPQVQQGTIVGNGNNRVSFGLSCTSTVYDVTYSLVWGNVTVFDKTLAAPRTAAIVKAPLQAGLGSYALFEKAVMSVLMSNLTVMDSMELAFSQTYLALAAGVFDRAPNIEQRWRAEVTLTKLGKGPFYLLVVGMFFYALVVLVFTVIALSIFRRSDVRKVQTQLMLEE